MAAAFPHLEERCTIAQLRKDQGLHECEVLGDGPEAEESKLAWEICDKTENSHDNFIPIQNFSEYHLPSRFHNTSLLRFILVIAELTVRLRISHVSAARPDGYIFASYKGKNVPFTGSGWVYKILPGEGPCPCHDCYGSQRPKFQWWRCIVLTACHVVYDKEEAKKTKVDLFYDTDKSLEDNKVKTLYGFGVEDNNLTDDVCLLQCATHDEDLVNNLKTFIEEYELLKWDVPESIMSTICVVISHPHGEPKKVTVGEISSMASFDPEASYLVEYMYTYSAETCRGSSGAPIVCAVSRKKLGSKGVWPGAGPHSFGHVEGTLNQCGPGIFYVEAELLSKTMRRDSLRNLKTATKFADIIFLLIGKTGVGKSALGNAILKQSVFRSDIGMASVTNNISFATSEFKGKTLKVADMMGLEDTRMSRNEGIELFLKQMQEAMSSATGKYLAFLLVLRFGMRFTEEDVNTIALLKYVFGTDFVRQNCILVMTYGDHFEDERREMDKEFTFEDWCQMQYGAFKELMEECEHRVLLFDNKTRKKDLQDQQIEKLLQMVNKMQAKGDKYTDRDFLLSQAVRDKISVELKEPEVREKVWREEGLVIRELEEKKFDIQYLKMLFMRTESLMRYVKREDKGSDSLQHLKLRVATLRKTVEDAVRILSTVNELRQRAHAREQEVNDNVQLQRQWFAQQLALLDKMQEERCSIHEEPKR
ncbi:GTPase imap family member 7 [Plakobranchus ocellatus]|uniref:GTPase imap family member 7 n=1 Tax=Plakobranchus ocellatus TaxID=259542 RepID=A0AAV4A6X1_9GAST|nr:GTPase imap family member 7 [Plakobranchus ocellatus]